MKRLQRIEDLLGSTEPDDNPPEIVFADNGITEDGERLETIVDPSVIVVNFVD